ncbi:MAG: hypothetical protein EOQ48_01805 [Mesorhizobium sp.]|uniref:hypothetical protein n=1 Tax=Mesorhizobium sp. TaxID=1871066 RepID=UPI000FE6135C|nr:MAG: hypothetical protein EOQ48_01805 [Mesorhizobium sp.]
MDEEQALSQGLERHVLDGKVVYLPKVPNADDKFLAQHAFKILREWNQKGTVPWMRRRTVDYLAPRLALWASILALFLHGWWATNTACSLHFARSGAAIVLISALAFGWTAWHEVPKLVVNRPAVFHPLLMLPALALFGTFVWGYGDLLPFGKSC